MIDGGLLDLMLVQRPSSQVSTKYSAIIGQDEKSASEDMMTGPISWIDQRNMRIQKMI